MKKISGQNLTEFVIVLVLIALAGILALTFLGDEIKKLFGGPASKYSANKPFEYSPTKTSHIQAGSLGGTPDKPFSQCDGDMCTIDFGDLILSGIPKDFNSYVDNVAASGGTEVISGLINQIAEQMEAQGQVDEAKLIKKMAVTAHNIAVTQKIAEEAIKKCGQNDAVCLEKLANSQFPPKDQIEGLDETFYSYETYYSFQAKLFGLSIGRAKDKQIFHLDEKDGFNDQIKHNAPAALFLRDFEEAQKDPKISEVTKSILSELYWDIGMLSEDFFVNFGYLTDPDHCGNRSDAEVNCDGSRWYCDPFDGYCHQANHYGVSNEGEDFLNYKASKISHFDGALICAAGNNKDTGTKCH